MEPNSTFSRNQELFLNALLLGESIIDAASHASVSKSTAFRWLRDPVFQAERKRRETAVSETEQAEINKILTSGYALIHKRVEALDKLATLLQEEVFDESKRWLLDVKAVGFERVDLKQFNGDLIKEYRATFADLAAELGQRVKKQEIDARVENSGNVAVYLPQKHDLRGNDASSDEDESDNS
jgi:transposase